MFDLPDELFISQAYWQVLGRPADPAGYVNYLNLLRSGGSRIQMLGEFQGSQEAINRRTHGPQQPAPTAAIDLWPSDRPAAQQSWRLFKRLRLIPDEQLLSLTDVLFLEAAFSVFLDRMPTNQERIDGAVAASTLLGRRQLLQTLKRKSPIHRRLWPRTPPVRARKAAELKAEATPSATHSHPSWQGQGGARPTHIHHVSDMSTHAPAAAGAGAGAFTIATRSYLPFVRVLMRSMQDVHQDFQLFVLLVEESTEDVDRGPWETVLACDLGICDFEDMSVRYDVVEMCTALKPFFFRWLLERTQLQRLIYIDPDIRLYQPLKAVERALDNGAAMVLTPHVEQPLPENGEPSTLTILKSGIFNLGFAALQRCDETMRFLDWWAEQLRTSALVSFEQNLFTDQRWCDLAVAFVPSLYVLRDSGYNVAYWNLPQRPVQETISDGWCIAGSPLVFFHFSGFSPDSPHRISKYQTRPIVEQQPVLQHLLSGYADELLAEGWRDFHCLPYAYGHIQTVVLSPALRSLFRKLKPTSSGMIRDEALELLLQQCPASPPEHPEGTAPLPGLMQHVHDLRDDLRSSFDLRTEQGRQSYAGWFWSTGIVEHGLTSLLRTKLRRSGGDASQLRKTA